MEATRAALTYVTTQDLLGCGWLPWRCLRPLTRAGLELGAFAITIYGRTVEVREAIEDIPCYAKTINARQRHPLRACGGSMVQVQREPCVERPPFHILVCVTNDSAHVHIW